MNLKKRGIIEKIINMLLNVFIFIFSVILLISIYNNVQIKLFGKDYSDFFGYSVFEVQTGSMAPEINPGDWIIVKSSNDIELKDVITYNQDGEYITHRVIGVYNGTYVTKGDANNSKDDPIDQKQVVGKVVKILANFGILKKTIFNPIVLVSIIITILICNFVFKNKKNEEKQTINLDAKLKTKEFVSSIVNKTKEIIDAIVKKTKKIFNITLGKVGQISTEKHNANPTKILGSEQNNQRQSSELSEKEIITIENQKTENEEEYIQDPLAYIPVDVSELDETFLEIANNEIEEEQLPEKKTIEQIEEPEIEKPTKLNLELLETGKKSKNVIEKFISVKVEELTEILNILDDDGKNYVNEPTIKNKFMSAYIDSKYYNYYGEIDNYESKKQITKIEKHLQNTAAFMKQNYKGSDFKYSDKVERFLIIFDVISKLEQAKESITDKKAKEEFYKKELTKFAKVSKWDNNKIKTSITAIMKIQRNYVGILEYLFKKLETNMFNLEFNKLKNDKNIFAVSLEHNISFGKVYSDYIIDKTYNEGVIAENKTVILLNILSIRLVKDMINSDFNKKYIVYLPRTLYSKDKKIEKTLSMIEDEHAKESVIILVGLEDLLKHKTLIKKLKKDGYNFALTLNSEFNIDAKNYTALNLVNYIFVDKKIPNIVKKLSNLPEDVVEKLIYEDVIEKIGDFGGEK